MNAVFADTSAHHNNVIVRISTLDVRRFATDFGRHQAACATEDEGFAEETFIEHHGAVHAAKELEQPMRVGAIASSDTFYDPDEGRHERWSSRGVLAVEMEAAVIFTLGALRKVKAGCLLTVSDIVIGGEFTRISDEDLQAAVDRMTRVALTTVTSD